MRAQFELLSDCPVCRVDGAIVEVYDPLEPACALGHPAESRCRICNARWASRVIAGPGAEGVLTPETGRCPLCEHRLRDDEIEAHTCAMCGTRAVLERVRESDPIGMRAVFEANLLRFAHDEGEGDLKTFLDVNFMGASVSEIHDRVLRGERTETTFDALFGLFHQGGRSGGGPHGAPTPRAVAAETPKVYEGARDGAEYDPRAMLLALVSVVLADGQTHPREAEFVDRFLTAEAMAPLRPEEYRVHRPMEISPKIPPQRRAEVVELMTQLACIDGEADPSEVRIVRSFAAAWGIGDEQVTEWLERFRWRYASDARRFLHRVRSFFVTE